MPEESLTRLLSKLPVELREMIWELALPAGLRHQQLGRPYDVHWLATSQALLREVGPYFYSDTPFYVYSSIWSSRGSSLVETLGFHIAITYKADCHMARTLVGPMITELVVDLRMDHGNSLFHGLKWYFQGTKDAFPNLKTLLVYFGPRFMDMDAGLVSTRHTFMKFGDLTDGPTSQPWMSPYMGSLGLIATLCPPGCEVRWQSFENLTKKRR